MTKYMIEFNVGDRIRDVNDGMVVEILQKYKNRNVKFKVLENLNHMWGFKISSVDYVHNTDNLEAWELAEEPSKNISPESIRELEKSIQKEETNLTQFVETTRKNIFDMKKNLESLKKTAIKIPTIVIGEMYSYNNSNGNDVVCICIRYENSDESWCMMFMDRDVDNLEFEWIYDINFQNGDITDFKHLNSPAQKKIASGFYAFFTGDIPGV